MAEKQFLVAIKRTVDIEVAVWAESKEEARALIPQGEGDWDEYAQEDEVISIKEMEEES